MIDPADLWTGNLNREAPGASEIAIVDTIGVASPEAVALIVGRARKWLEPALPIHWHSDNDVGLATAAAIASVCERHAGAGYSQRHGRGIGYRATSFRTRPRQVETTDWRCPVCSGERSCGEPVSRSAGHRAARAGSCGGSSASGDWEREWFGLDSTQGGRARVRSGLAAMAQTVGGGETPRCSQAWLGQR